MSSDVLNIYPDNSFLNRPFDDQTVGLNSIESEILQAVLELVQTGRLLLVNSSVILYENSRDPLSERQLFVSRVLRHATFFQGITREVERRAAELHREQKIRALDALHCAAAEAAGANFLVTCDNELAARYAGPIEVAKPVAFVYHYYYEHEKKK